MGTSKNRGSANAKFHPRRPNGERHCSCCREMRSAASFNVDRSRYDGLGYICAPCRDAKRTKPGPTIRLRRERRADGMAWCSGCEEWKELALIHAGFCQPCANRNMRERYAEDPDFRFRRKQRSIARKRNVEPVPLGAAESILDEFDGRCAYCPAPATTWDHVVAVTKGGLTEPCNIVPACGSCNSSKRTQNVWDWIEKSGREPHHRFYERVLLYHAGMFPARGPDPFE